MISFISGILVELQPEYLVMEVGGIGYEIYVHARAAGHMPGLGCPVRIYTHFQVLDNEFKLYGFLDKEELNLFRRILTISGMGAKAALSVLGTMEPVDFYRAVASQDEKALTRIPGIGKKSAQRLLFELRDKVEEISARASSDKNVDDLDDLLAALESLGYSRSEVWTAIIDLKEKNHLSDRVEENIKKVLRRMGSK